MIVAPTGYLKSHPATEQEARLQDVDTNRNPFYTYTVVICLNSDNSALISNNNNLV